MQLNTMILSLFAIFNLACSFNQTANSKNPEQPSRSPIVAASESKTRAEEKPATGENNRISVEEINYLSLANGAFLAKQPDRRMAFDYAPINLIIDGLIWRSPTEDLNNQVFVIETPGETVLKKIEFNTSHPFYTFDENAREILLEASNSGADSGFQTILETSLEKQTEQNQSFPVKTEVPARWFRLTVKNNHGSAEATALRGIRGYGTQKSASIPQNLTGTYRLIDAETGKLSDSGDCYDVFVKQDGTTVSGCRNGSESFSGGLEGTVAKINWTQPDFGKNNGLMIFTGKNRLVYWRVKDGSFWAFEEFEKVNSDLGECAGMTELKDKDSAKTKITEDLQKDGRAVIYGINFDFNSDKLRDESKIVLDKIVAVLKENTGWKMKIEGHTDNIGGENYNQNLSEKRANSVKMYLINAGIDSSRLSSSGRGLSSPIEPNETEFGRAQNRRVELVRE